MPEIRRVLETALYVEDLDRAVDFYGRLMGLRALTRGDRLTAMDAGQGTVLLLFARGSTEAGAEIPGGWIPPHSGTGPSHFALAVDEPELERWRSHLEAAGVDIESEVKWESGGRSLYFRDPDGHSVELASPGIWDEVY
jgi:catechol 2,3-dioxygenase-like lactoylglutathione lyase family enzyme